MSQKTRLPDKLIHGFSMGKTVEATQTPVCPYCGSDRVFTPEVWPISIDEGTVFVCDDCDKTCVVTTYYVCRRLEDSDE